MAPAGRALAGDMVLDPDRNLVSGSMCLSPLYSHCGLQMTFPVSVVGWGGGSGSGVLNDVILKSLGLKICNLLTGRLRTSQLKV